MFEFNYQPSIQQVSLVDLSSLLPKKGDSVARTGTNKRFWDFYEEFLSSIQYTFGDCSRTLITVSDLIGELENFGDGPVENEWRDYLLEIEKVFGSDMFVDLNN